VCAKFNNNDDSSPIGLVAATPIDATSVLSCLGDVNSEIEVSSYFNL